MWLDIKAFDFRKNASQPNVEQRLDLSKEKKLVEGLEKGSPNGWTPFHIAIYLNDARLFNSSLENAKVNPNQKDKHGNSPLSLAVSLGRLDMVKALMEKKVEKENVLLVSIEQRQLASARILLENKVNPNVRGKIVKKTDDENKIGDDIQILPLEAAIVANDPRMVDLLIGFGADVKKAGLHTPLELLAMKSTLQDTFESGYESLRNIDMLDEKGYNLLYYTIKQENYDRAHEMIKRGANPHFVYKDGKTVFQMMQEKKKEDAENYSL